MKLFDRLDAVDARLGLVHAPKRPPNRLARRMARHPWRTAILYSVLMVIVQVVPRALFGPPLSLVLTMTFCLSAVALGLVVAFSARNAVVRWNQRDTQGADDRVSR